MEKLFLQLFNMSITASWLVIAVILIRMVIKKAPRWITCLLWGLVGIRLLLPISIESVFSLIPSAQTLPQETLLFDAPEINSGIPAINNAINPILSESLAPRATYSANPWTIAVFIATVIWITGVVIMLTYAVISYIRLRLHIRGAVHQEGRIWASDKCHTPFIIGIINPKIILPESLDSNEREYVIAHEKAHLKRLDHITKPLGFALLCIYWFNPLLWVAYILLCRDIETACDQRVIKCLGEEIKKPYSTALLNCSVKSNIISACPLAFGETGVKSRIKSVLNYKKPGFWVVAVCVVISTALAVGFLTNPKTEKSISCRSSYTTCDQVLITETTVTPLTAPPKVIMKWENNTGKEITYGDEYHLYYLDGEEKQDCDQMAQREWHTLLYSFIGNKDYRTFYLHYYDLTKLGDYVLEFDFSLQDGEKHTAYIHFSLTDKDSKDIVSVAEIDHSTSSTSYIGGEELSVEESEKIISILKGYTPINDVTKCAFDYYVNLTKSGKLYHYHSECGTFCDYSKKQSINVSDEHKRIINDILERQPTFFASIVKNNGGNFLVKAHDNQTEWGEYFISTKCLSEEEIADFKEGDKIKIVYDGMVLESYPMQIHTVYSITKK